MRIREQFISGMLAGIMISIGGMVFLATENIVAGAVFFCVGLFSVCSYGLGLFTGSVGYLIGSRPAYAAELLIIWLGNLAGCVLMGFAVRLARPALVVRAEAICLDIKLVQNMGQTLVLGILCGLLMYIAVDNYRKNKMPLGRYLGMLLCVPAFILAGFEHCVADMFYFAAGGRAEDFGAMILFLLVATAGNSLGAFLLPLAGKGNTCA